MIHSPANLVMLLSRARRTFKMRRKDEGAGGGGNTEAQSGVHRCGVNATLYRLGDMRSLMLRLPLVLSIEQGTEGRYWNQPFRSSKP